MTKAVAANCGRGGVRGELVTARLVTGDNNGRDDIDVQQPFFRNTQKNIGSIDVEIGVDVMDMRTNPESKSECFVVCCAAWATRAIDPAGVVERREIIPRQASNSEASVSICTASCRYAMCASPAGRPCSLRLTTRAIRPDVLPPRAASRDDIRYNRVVRTDNSCR